MKKCGIVGAGVIGRVLAWRLAKLGWQVSLFDNNKKDSFRGCSYVAAGMLSPTAELGQVTEDIFTWGLESIDLWGKWLQEIDHSVFFQRTGSILLAHIVDSSHFSHIVKRIQRNGEVEIIDKKKLTLLEPELSGWNGLGVYLPLDGQIDNQEFLKCSSQTLLDLGVIWHENIVINKIFEGMLSTKDDVNYSFDLVFDCRGLGAKESLAGLRGVRGEIIHLLAPEVNITRPVRLMHPRYNLYLVPRPDNIYIIGATEVESEDYQPITVRSTLELLSACYSVHPGFAEAKIITTLVNCRPALPDNLPRILFKDGLVVVNGFYRHGWLLAPWAVNKIITTLLERGY